MLFSLNFSSRLSWIFRQHSGEHSWESTFIQLKDAYGITSQPAFHQGKCCPLPLLHCGPSILCRWASFIWLPPQLFFQSTHFEQKQRRSGARKACAELEKARIYRQQHFVEPGLLIEPVRASEIFLPFRTRGAQGPVPEFVWKPSKHHHMAQRATWIPSVC